MSDPLDLDAARARIAGVRDRYGTPKSLLAEMVIALADTADAAVDELEATRAELRNQWEHNHFEHCGFPLIDGHCDEPPYGCQWPLPALLEGTGV